MTDQSSSANTAEIVGAIPVGRKLYRCHNCGALFLTVRDRNAHEEARARTSFDMTAEEREIEFGSDAELRAGTR